MKTAFVTDRVSRHAGGLFDACKHLAQKLQAAGDDVRVFGVSDDCSEEDGRSWGPVALELEPSLPLRGVAWAPGMGAALRAFSPDVVHLHGLWNHPSWTSGRWHARSGLPEVIHPHGMLDPWALRNSGWKKRMALATFERAHLERASCIRALCDSERDAVRQMGVMTPVCVIPNGIALPSLDFTVRGTALVTAGPKTLLYLGRLHPKKGLAALIEAWHRLGWKSADSGWKLAIAGWDQDGHEGELKVLADKLGIFWLQEEVNSKADILGVAPGIVFHGPQFGADKEALYRSADAFILPSVSEGLPMVVLEAWAHAKPVLMTPMCNLPEGFVAGAAISVDPQADDIAVGLQKLAGMSRIELETMGLAGRALVESRFTWERVATQVVEINQWLVHGGECPEFVDL